MKVYPAVTDEIMDAQTEEQPFKQRMKSSLISLYHGASLKSKIFRRALLSFDIAAILFFIAISVLEENPVFRTIEYGIAAVILLDFLARFWIAPNRANYFMQLTTWADMIVFVSLLAPVFFENLLFLRILRTLRLLRSYHILKDLRARYPYFKEHEELIQSIINLSVFIFVVAALVYVLQVRINPQITNYIDALYFTVTTLTTTGFGDITLQGSSGRLLAVLIMVVGVALFLRLIQTIFQPTKVHYPCPQCGLKRHDPDAVHCKHCGHILHIETEGFG